MKKIFTLLSTVIILNIPALAQPVTQSQKLIGGTGDEFLYGFSNNPTSDGGSIIGGSTTSSNTGTFTGLTNNGDVDGLLTKIDASGNITLQKLYGGSAHDEILSIRQTADGGYIAVGDSKSSNTGTLTGITNNGGYDGWVMKLDASGNVVWQKLLGGSSDDILYSAGQTADGGYIVSGSSNSSNSGTLTGLNNNGGLDAWIMKLDASGNTVWQKLLGGGSFDRFIESSPTADGGYIAVGTATGSTGTLTGVTSYGGLDGWIVKFDAAGNTTWQKLFGGGSDDQFGTVKQTTDGGYILAYAAANVNSVNGTYTVAGYGQYDGWVVKTDGSGNLQWQKLLGTSSQDFFTGIQLTSDGGYILVGQASSGAQNHGSLTGLTFNGGYDGWIVKLNGAGDLQWQELLGGNMDDNLTTIHETSDGGYFAAGYTNSASGTGTLTGLTNNGGNDGWIVKLAPFATPKKPGSGNTLQFDGSSNYVESSPLNFALGTSFSANAWIKTTDFEGDIVCNFEEASTFQGFLFGIGFGSVGNNADSRAGKLGFYVANSSVGGSYNDLTGRRVDDGKWHHVAVTYNGSNVTFYIDGNLSSTVSATNIPIGNSSNVLRIGRDNNNPGIRYLNGQVDELQLWSTTLTQTQIRDWMCKKVTPAHPAYNNLLAYFRFDEGSGDTTYSMDGRAGVLVNSPAWLTSGASVGDASAYDYTNATKTANLTASSGEKFTVTNTSGAPDGLQIYRVDTIPNTTNGANSGTNNKYFGVFQVNGTSPTYTAVYNYNGNPLVTSYDENMLRLFKRADNSVTTWTDAMATLNTGSKTLTAAGQSTEYILGVASGTLPVSLINFTGYKVNAAVRLNWQSENEINFSGFEIERSSDGLSFNSTGQINAQHSQGINSYSFIDNAPLAGNNFYRLKQINTDGKFTYSKIVKVDFGKKYTVYVYPNPASDKIYVEGILNYKYISITEVTGKIVYQQKITQGSETINISNLQKGVYFIKFINDNFEQTQKLIKE